jgi:hypothetical protein
MSKKIKQKVNLTQSKKKVDEVAAKALEPDPWEKKQKRVIK